MKAQLIGLIVCLLICMESPGEIRMMRHSTARDFANSWGDLHFVENQSESAQDVYETLTHLLVVDNSVNPPQLLKSSRHKAQDKPVEWGHYPEGSRFSNPVFAQGKIWLYVLNQKFLESLFVVLSG